jgi:serine/threonine-protein kinase
VSAQLAGVIGENPLPRRFGPYLLVDKIGEGGMAEIFMAHGNIGLGAHKRLVVKQILPLLAQNQSFCQLLINEAKLSAKLSHPAVVQVFDLGREGDSLYIAMEYVEGVDLRQLLRECARKQISLPLEHALYIVLQVLEGLEYAHGKCDEEGASLGIVHRDVSPSNVLLSMEGEVKLCDFGIARALGVASAIPDDAIQGKAGYMSPEAANGENIDGRADLFSVGIILWELLSGRRLYKGEKGKPPPLALAQQADIPPLSLPGMPGEAELQRIVGKALQKDIAARYQNAAELRRDLEQYLHDQGLIASPLRLGRWLREQCTPEVIERRRALEQAVLASAADFAAENTDHSHITPAHRDRAATEAAAATAGPVTGGTEGTQAHSSRARNIALFVVVVVIAFALGVLVRLR